jgi:uncharacterized membrane protein YjjP (DUF1212 family)
VEVRETKMIKSITVTNEEHPLTGAKTLQRINRILQLVAAAYSDDPGTSDLDDSQPVYAVKGLDLGDVRLARRLTRPIRSDRDDWSPAKSKDEELERVLRSNG